MAKQEVLLQKFHMNMKLITAQTLKQNFNRYRSNENQNLHVYFGDGTELFAKPTEAIAPGPLIIIIFSRISELG